ncbi:MAG: hypothetical protein ABW054_07380 [Casimicrobiaceae bacterium]
MNRAAIVGIAEYPAQKAGTAVTQTSLEVAADLAAVAHIRIGGSHIASIGRHESVGRSTHILNSKPACPRPAYAR